MVQANPSNVIQSILPGGCIWPRNLISQRDLEPFIGMVVKCTTDKGNTWNFVLLDKKIYSTDKNDIKNEGIVAFSEQTAWNDKLVSMRVVISDDTFDPCLNGGMDVYFETAAYSDFADKTFPGKGKLDSSYASEGKFNPFPNPYPFPGPVLRAPLTLVRSERQDINLDISIIFNHAFEPALPTFPFPTKILEKLPPIFTWEVHVNKDKTLSTSCHKVKMIWWEAMRKSDPKPMNVEDSTCIRKEEIGAFIRDVLTKKGVTAEEQHAFVVFWEQSFKNTSQEYLRVRLAKNEELSSLIPEMKVNSCNANFNVSRFYFQFSPMDSAVSGMSRESILRASKPKTWAKMSLSTSAPKSSIWMAQPHLIRLNRASTNSSSSSTLGRNCLPLPLPERPPGVRSLRRTIVDSPVRPLGSSGLCPKK